jgi:16S rRNA G966 N2-methylase RsmD
VLEENLQSLGLSERGHVWSLALPRGLARLAAELAAADLVLLDPPYGDPAADETLRALGKPGTLGARVRVVVEHHAKHEPPESIGTLSRRRLRRYGETAVSTYEVDPVRAAEDADREVNP